MQPQVRLRVPLLRALLLHTDGTLELCALLTGVVERLLGRLRGLACIVPCLRRRRDGCLGRALELDELLKRRIRSFDGRSRHRDHQLGGRVVWCSDLGRGLLRGVELRLRPNDLAFRCVSSFG